MVVVKLLRISCHLKKIIYLKFISFRAVYNNSRSIHFQFEHILVDCIFLNYCSFLESILQRLLLSSILSYLKYGDDYLTLLLVTLLNFGESIL